MKLLAVALCLVVALGSADAFWYGGYGGYGLYGMYGMYGYGYGLWGKRSAELKPEAPTVLRNRTECVYLSDASMLSCRGMMGVVECETKTYPETETLDMPFELYGLSRAEGYYRLMPRKADNTEWVDNVMMINGSRYNAELYYSAEEVERFGLRVLDEKCFQKLDEDLQASLRNEHVYYKTLEGTEETTFLRGDLIVTKTPVMEGKDEKETEEMTKRWWGGFYGSWYYPYSYGYYYGKRSDGPVVEMKREEETFEMAQKRSTGSRRHGSHSVWPVYDRGFGPYGAFRRFGHWH